MATSPITGITLPNSTSTDQVPADLLTAFTAAEKMFIGQFASASARDTKITAPVAGMTCWLNTPGCYSEYLGAAGWKNRYSTGTQFWFMGWPNLTVAGTGNISTATQTITPNIGPYMMRVTMNCLFTAGGQGVPSLQMVINGVQQSVFTVPLPNANNTNYTAALARDFYVSDGSTFTVVGRLQIPFGTTCTTYSDGTHSYVTIAVQPA